MQPTRIACVRYLNTQPLINGLDRVQGLTLLPAVPSAIGAMVASGDADVGLASIVDAVTVNPSLSLIPVGMIGSDGPTLTVRIFSSVPIDRITVLHADTESHTSVVLAQLILGTRYGIRPTITPHNPAVGDAWPAAVLLIGDKVVTNHPPESHFPHQLDLGEAWHSLTGLPFVYAMWMCRSAEVDTPAIRLASSLLDRQLRHNLGRMEWITTTQAPLCGWPIDLARRYLGQYLRFQVGEREQAAATEFFRRAAAHKLLPERVPQWATPIGTQQADGPSVRG